MTMENLLTPVILTFGFILAGTHTINAQCEFNDTIIHYTLGHLDSSGMGDIFDVYVRRGSRNGLCFQFDDQFIACDF